MDKRERIVEILERAIKPPKGYEPFTYYLATGLIADEILTALEPG